MRAPETVAVLQRDTYSCQEPHPAPREVFSPGDEGDPAARHVGASPCPLPQLPTSSPISRATPQGEGAGGPAPGLPPGKGAPEHPASRLESRIRPLQSAHCPGITSSGGAGERKGEGISLSTEASSQRLWAAPHRQAAGAAGCLATAQTPSGHPSATDLALATGRRVTADCCSPPPPATAPGLPHPPGLTSVPLDSLPAPQG